MRASFVAHCYLILSYYALLPMILAMYLGIGNLYSYILSPSVLTLLLQWYT
jgi:hypothetical protein